MMYEDARAARQQIEERLSDACRDAKDGAGFHLTERGREVDKLSQSLAKAIHVEYRAKR